MSQLLDTRLPAGWPAKNVDERRKWFRDIKDKDELAAQGVEFCERVCAAEYLCEYMGRGMADKDCKYSLRKVTKLLNKMPGWERMGASGHADKLYGVQKAFRRVTRTDDEGDL